MKKKGFFKSFFSNSKEVRRSDGWQNMLSGIGSYSQDRDMHSTAVWDRLSEEEAEAIYASDKIAKIVIDKIVETSLIQGYRLSFKDMDEQKHEDFNTDRNDILDKYYNLEEIITLALIWARIYGISYIMPGYNCLLYTSPSPRD